jgi:hypothetical protein
METWCVSVLVDSTYIVGSVSQYCPSLILFLQDTWTKKMYALSELLSRCGQDAVKIVERMEEKGAAVAPGSFKPLEPFRHPEDYQTLTLEMLKPNVHANPSTLKQVAGRILQRRWWTWLLEHPGLGVDIMHPTRSMFAVSMLLCPCAYKQSHCIQSGTRLTTVSICVLFTENQGEVAALSSALSDPLDAKVNCGRWTWTPQDPWPPLKCVMDAKFWSDNKYAGLRAGLLHELPNPEMLHGGEYSTVYMKAGKPKAVIGDVPDPAAGDAEAAESSTQQAVPSQGAGGGKKQTKTRAVTGKVHIVGMAAHSVIPKAISDKKYGLIVIEVGDNEAGQGINSVVSRLMVRDKATVAAVVGANIDVEEAVNAITNNIPTQTYRKKMFLCGRPSRDDGNYLFSQWVIMLLSSRSMYMHVCPLPQFTQEQGIKIYKKE